MKSDIWTHVGKVASKSLGICLALLHHMRVVLVILIVLLPTDALACVIDTAIETPFTTMNPIPVCIHAPTEEVRANSFAQFRESEATIREAIRAMAEQSNLEFLISTAYCDVEATPLRPAMRIRLADEFEGAYGRAGRADISPGFAEAEQNLFVSHLFTSDGVIFNQDNLTYTIQHEIMHLLGIQHDHRGQSASEIAKVEEAIPTLVALADFSRDSFMNGTMEEEFTRRARNENMRPNVDRLPNSDVACINLTLDRAASGGGLPVLPQAGAETTISPHTR